MSNLERWLENRNALNVIFKAPPIEHPRTAEQCKPLFSCIEGELSPENIYCDGECSLEEAHQQMTFLALVWAELEEITGFPVEQNI